MLNNYLYDFLSHVLCKDRHFQYSFKKKFTKFYCRCYTVPCKNKRVIINAPDNFFILSEAFFRIISIKSRKGQRGVFLLSEAKKNSDLCRHDYRIALFMGERRIGLHPPSAPLALGVFHDYLYHLAAALPARYGSGFQPHAYRLARHIGRGECRSGSIYGGG